MYYKETTLVGDEGLHARPASALTAEANKYEATITLSAKDKEADAKSIIALLSMGLSSGSDIKVLANGPDEIKAVDALVALIDTNFKG